MHIYLAFIDVVGRTSTIFAGVLLGIRGGGVPPPGCSHPDPFSGQKTLFSIPLFNRPWLDRQPKKIVEIQFE